MNSTKKTYCRLCAELKPPTEFTDLETDIKCCEEVANKLRRLNCNLNFNEHLLPKTICLTCINALQSAFNFVTTVEAAQVELTDLFLLSSVKIEIVSSDSDSVPYEYPCENSDDESSESSDSEYFNDEPTDQKLGDKKCQIEDNTSIEPISTNNHLTSQENKDLDNTQTIQSKLTWSDYGWTCTFCETQFPNFVELKTHSMEYHQVCNAFRCTDCNNKYLRLDNFITHICKHRKYLQLTCHKCRAIFSTLRDVKRHKAYHITTRYKCDGCNSCFSNSNKLQKHMKTYYKNARSKHLRTELQPHDLVCSICKKKSSSKRAYNLHLLVHTDRKRDHICDICGKSFMTKMTLAAHMMFHEDKRPFKCEICKSGFRTKNYLNKHISIHEGTKQFSCEQCDKSFRLKVQLKSHSIVHTDSLPYKCSYCTKQFRFSTLLKIHTRQHTGEKPYSCDICEKFFTNWSNYNKHMKRIHNKNMTKKKHKTEEMLLQEGATGKEALEEIKVEQDKAVSVES